MSPFGEGVSVAYDQDHFFGRWRFAEHDVAFGMFPGIIHDLLLYIVDNEVHHRGQGYVYLRALGLEPVQFYDRG